MEYKTLILLAESELRKAQRQFDVDWAISQANKNKQQCFDSSYLLDLAARTNPDLVRLARIADDCFRSRHPVYHGKSWRLEGFNGVWDGVSLNFSLEREAMVITRERKEIGVITVDDGYYRVGTIISALKDF